MSKEFPSDEWARALADQVGLGGEYARAADGWAAGDVALTIAPAAGDAGAQSDAVLISLSADGASAARALPTDSARSAAAIVLEASADTWSGLLRGERDPVKALMNGDVKVSKGDLATVVGQVFAYAALLEAAARI